MVHCCWIYRFNQNYIVIEGMDQSLHSAFGGYCQSGKYQINTYRIAPLLPSFECHNGMGWFWNSRGVKKGAHIFVKLTCSLWLHRINRHRRDVWHVCVMSFYWLRNVKTQWKNRQQTHSKPECGENENTHRPYDVNVLFRVSIALNDVIVRTLKMPPLSSSLFFFMQFLRCTEHYYCAYARMSPTFKQLIPLFVACSLRQSVRTYAAQMKCQLKIYNRVAVCDAKRQRHTFYCLFSIKSVSPRTFHCFTLVRLIAFTPPNCLLPLPTTNTTGQWSSVQLYFRCDSH